ncbi:MAG: pyruvate ferredoxin oxidoreductase [Deltaproteobacteria bacterium]|nr:MAG: pyruvate ferredoxin oxidoreductase [Deltaproteobacteria bacterium]
MSATKIITGNETAALAAKLCKVQVIAAYPITPQSKIPETLSAYVESGELDAEFVRVESEHSAMGVCISASLVGARVFTATSANGLAYMNEQLHWAAGARVPIVMAVANRGLGAPWTILNDMQDTLSQRDTGWIQLYCKNNQEILDKVIMAFKLSERVLVPTMVCFDGFRLSHTVMPVEVPDQKEVDEFLPPFEPVYEIDPDNPININPVVMTDPLPGPDGELCPSYMGFRRRLQKTLENVLPVYREVGTEFAEKFGRDYSDPFYRYRADDAEILFVAQGSVASEATAATDILRDKGIKIGVLGLNIFRPFPAEDLSNATKNARVLAVFEKGISYGYEGVLCSELKAALFSHNGHRPQVLNFIVGLGGKDLNPGDLVGAIEDVLAKMKEGHEMKTPQWLGSGV